MKKLFGTDGVRGIANVDLDSSLVFNIGRATAWLLTEGSPKGAVFSIGRDTRASGDMFEAALTAGICSTGAHAVIMGIVPTAAVSVIVKNYCFDGGFMITASHNPPEYNGIKIFDKKGFKLNDSMELKLETLLDSFKSNDNYISLSDIGTKINFSKSSTEAYLAFLKNEVSVKLDSLKIVMDCGNGASYSIGPRLLKELGAEVCVINNLPNGKNINSNCGSLYPKGLVEKVLETRSCVGLAYDGDADRLIVVDEVGNILSGDSLMVIFAKYLKEENNLKENTLVTTEMSNLGLEATLNKINCQVVRTEVGDRYILQEMIKNKFNLGGEKSGHFIFYDSLSSSDGLLSTLNLLRILKKSGKALSSLASNIEEFPQTLINVKVNNSKKHLYKNYDEVNKKIDYINHLLKERGRFYLRIAGTEPMLRLLVEGRNINDVLSEVHDLKKILEVNLK